MFFPVYLIRDFGAPGWLAFAIPNVIGAASVGPVMAQPGRTGGAAGLMQRHARMMRAFSFVTVLFHVSFLSWLMAIVLGSEAVGGQGYMGPGFAMLALWLAMLAAAAPWRWLIGLGGPLVLAGSMAFAWLAWRGGALQPPRPSSMGNFGISSLLMASPALAFGFLFCPYLDMTLLRMRRDDAGLSRREGTSAFMLGFLVIFPALIGFTMLYAESLLHQRLSWWILGHIVLQSVFTMGLHWKALLESGAADPSGQEPSTNPRLGGASSDGRSSGRVALIATALLLALCTGALPYLGSLRPGYGMHRLSYELFLSAYALPFAAYVWIVMLGEAGQGGAGTEAEEAARRRRRKVWAVSCIAAAPILLFGYVLQHWWAVPIGVAIPAAGVIPLTARRAGR